MELRIFETCTPTFLTFDLLAIQRYRTFHSDEHNKIHSLFSLHRAANTVSLADAFLLRHHRRGLSSKPHRHTRNGFAPVLAFVSSLTQGSRLFRLVSTSSSLLRKTRLDTQQARTEDP